MIYQYIVPIIPSEPQLLNVTLPISGENKSLELSFRFNEMSNYWWMDIRDPIKGTDLVYGIPLIIRGIPAENLMEQYDYLGIGGCVLVAESELLHQSIPTFDNLGTQWFLVWGSNETIQ